MCVSAVRLLGTQSASLDLNVALSCCVLLAQGEERTCWFRLGLLFHKLKPGVLAAQVELDV